MNKKYNAFFFYLSIALTVCMELALIPVWLTGCALPADGASERTETEKSTGTELRDASSVTLTVENGMAYSDFELSGSCSAGSQTVSASCLSYDELSALRLNLAPGSWTLSLFALRRGRPVRTSAVFDASGGGTAHFVFMEEDTQVEKNVDMKLAYLYKEQKLYVYLKEPARVPQTMLITRWCDGADPVVMEPVNARIRSSSTGYLYVSIPNIPPDGSWYSVYACVRYADGRETVTKMQRVQASGYTAGQLIYYSADSSLYSQECIYTPCGVIYDVTADGYKMVALDDLNWNGNQMLQWSDTYNARSFVRDDESGITVMKVMDSMSNSSFEGYPLFVACRKQTNFGGKSEQAKWYIPALGELEKIRQLADVLNAPGNREYFTPLRNDWYWTASVSDSKVTGYNVADGTTELYRRTDWMYGRAVYSSVY